MLFIESNKEFMSRCGSYIPGCFLHFALDIDPKKASPIKTADK
ncbi:hypothetical protein BSI_11530 [Bacillus inaquosorum KCTC 13429]|uniref:Uncharacterized protein n=1 Tax=Bacillus inaquosorum KCTC 13429 TaxID=1236548 RepID=A0A9W5PDP9_9BACI|nr:hypothetical protein BSI_11530 [Bacillus inaquosorum KCTC 13429]